MHDSHVDEERAGKGGPDSLEDGIFLEPSGADGKSTDNHDNNEEEKHE